MKQRKRRRNRAIHSLEWNIYYHNKLKALKQRRDLTPAEIMEEIIKLRQCCNEHRPYELPPKVQALSRFRFSTDHFK